MEYQTTLDSWNGEEQVDVTLTLDYEIDSYISDHGTTEFEVTGWRVTHVDGVELAPTEENDVRVQLDAEAIENLLLEHG